MKFFLAALFSLLITPAAFSAESTAFVCRLAGSPMIVPVRMKAYIDDETNTMMGKVDRLKDGNVIKSTTTKVIMIPLVNRDTYMQVWYADRVTLDAQLSYQQGLQPFPATYKSSDERLELYCQQLRD